MEKINVTKIPIREKTLVVRISRGELASNIFFRKSRSPATNTKDFFGVDLGLNQVAYVFDRRDLESWARERDYLKGYEYLVSAKGDS